MSELEEDDDEEEASSALPMKKIFIMLRNSENTVFEDTNTTFIFCQMIAWSCIASSELSLSNPTYLY